MGHLIITSSSAAAAIAHTSLNLHQVASVLCRVGRQRLAGLAVLKLASSVEDSASWSASPRSFPPPVVSARLLVFRPNRSEANYSRNYFPSNATHVAGIHQR